MELLKRLGLKPTAAMQQKAAVAASATASAKSSVATRDAAPAAPHGSNGNAGQAAPADGARQAALAVQGKLEERLREASEQARKLADGKEKLDKLVAAAPAAQKKDLEAKKKLLDDRVRSVDREIAEMHGDLAALQNPATKREEYVAILARAGAKTDVGAKVEVDKHDEVIGKSRLDKRETTTKTSYEDGQAVTSRQEKTRTVGLGSVESTTSRSIEETTAQAYAKIEHEKSTKVSLKGVSIEEKRSTEIEHGDKKWSREQTRSTEIGKEGVSRTSTDKVTRSDGTATATTTTSAVERGDGKVGVAAGRSKTTTDAQGNDTTRGGSGKVGMTADDGSLGGYGEGKGSVARQGPGGLKGGGDLGLSAAAKCTIGEPVKGLYPVTVQVMVGASIGVSGGHAKKEATQSGSVEMSASKSFVFERTHQLDAKQLAGYVQALQMADKGQPVGATYKELSLLSIGASQGWDEARKFLSGKQSLHDAVGAQAGESASVSTKSAHGGKLSADVEMLKVGASASETDSHSTKATRTDTGALSVESNVGHGSERAGSVGVGMGAVSGSAGRSHTLQTSIGYTITIEAAADPKGELLREFEACTTEALQEKFIATYKGRIKVTGKKTTRKESSGETAEIKLGVGLGVGNQHGTDESVETDGDGKLRRSTVAGTNKSEGHLSLAGQQLGGSEATSATSTREGDDARLEVTDTHAETNIGKLVKHLIGRDEDSDKKKKKGLVATVAGKEKNEEEDAAATEDRDLDRIGVSKSDLALIVKIAGSDPGRWSHCAGRKQDYDDWVAVGRAIARSDSPGDAADLLAKFVGGGSSSRREVIENLIRPSGNVSMAARSEFPESLKKQRAPYDELVAQPCEAQIAETARKDGAEAAGKLGQQLIERLGRLLDAVSKAKDFTSGAAQAEMVSAINDRKTKVLAAMRRNAKVSPDADKQADKDEFARMLRECAGYQSSEMQAKSRIYKLMDDRPMVLSSDAVAAQHMFRDLRNLHAIWKRDYAKMDALAKKIGQPEPTYVAFQPQLSDMKKLYRGCWSPEE